MSTTPSPNAAPPAASAAVPSSSIPVTAPASSSTKKRKRPTKRKTKEATTTSRTATPPPSSTLIIDNGGHTIKFGWSTSSSPKHMPNVTAKLQLQWTVLVGDELDRVQPNQLESTTRSTERGVVTRMANQIQVWKRILDHLGVAVPITTEAAQVFGWKIPKNKKATILPQSCAVLLLLPPHYPRCVLEQIINVWFQDFHFGHVGFGVSSVMAASKSTAACIVDIGWSGTHVVPTYQQRPVHTPSIRRMPLGGRHLNQLWKYYTSYRQWNLMDQEFLLEEVQSELGFFSLDFEKDLSMGRRLPAGKRPYDRLFVLPDYSTNYKGEVQLPPALQQQQAGEEEEEDEETKQADEEKQSKEEDEEDSNKNDDNEADNEEQADSDEEESDEVKRQRIMRQRQEEERRRREQELERQVLMVSVERFAISEVLFRPSDAGLAPDLAGLPYAIAASIAACPRHYQALMYQSIRVVGGLAKIPNLQERLDRELRCLAPCQYEVRIEVSETPMEEAWLGAKHWLQRKPFSEWSISMSEFEAFKKDSKKPKPWHRLFVDKGGAVV